MQMNCELWHVGCLLSRNPKLEAWGFHDWGYVMLFKPPKELFLFLFFINKMILQLNYKKIIYIYISRKKNSKLKVDSKKSKNLEWPPNLYLGLVLVAAFQKKSFVLTKQEKNSYK